MFSLAHSVVSSLLSSESGTVFNRLGKEGNVLNGGRELGLGVSKEGLGVSNGLFTLSLRSGVGVSGVGRGGDFSLTDDQIFVVLLVSGGLFSLFLSNEFIDKSNNIINNTFGSEVNL